MAVLKIISLKNPHSLTTDIFVLGVQRYVMRLIFDIFMINTFKRSQRLTFHFFVLSRYEGDPKSKVS